MDFLLPYPTMRPSPPVKSNLRSKSSKLSLKHRATDSHKEMNSEALKSRKKRDPLTTNHQLSKDLFSSLISSDESDHDDKLLSDSTFFQGSLLNVPQAESTRLDINVRWSNDDPNPASFFSCKSKLTPSSSDAEPEGACEESIIEVSDNESMPPPKFNLQAAIVIPESTDSESTDDKSKRLNSVTKDATIILDSSSEDEAVLLSKHLAGKNVLSELNNLSKNKQIFNSPLEKKQDQWRNIVIPTSSSCTDESDDVVESSIHRKERKIFTPSSRDSPIKKKSCALKRNRILSSSSEETVEQENISPRTLAAEKLSQTKVYDIQRWIDGNAKAEFDNTEIESTSEKSSLTSGKPLWQKRDDDQLSSDDSFDKVIKRNRGATRKRVSPKSSFIVDDSSSSDASFSNYRRVLVGDVLRDVKRTSLDSEDEVSSELDWDPGFSTNKKRGGKPTKMKPPPPPPVSQKTGLNSFPKPAKKLVDDLSRPVEKPVAAVSRPVKKPVDVSRPTKKTADDVSRPTKKPLDDISRPAKKPVDDTPRPAKKPVDDTPRPAKKPVDDTPRPVKKPVKETPKTLKKSSEGDFRTPARPLTGKSNKVQDLKKPSTPYSPIRTFLTTLSGPAKDPSLRNHPEASIYFKNYKSKKEELARRLFKLFNREVFDSRLPDDLTLEWSGRMLSTAGFCKCKLLRGPGGTTREARIVLSTKVRVEDVQSRAKVVSSANALLDSEVAERRCPRGAMDIFGHLRCTISLGGSTFQPEKIIRTEHDFCCRLYKSLNISISYETKILDSADRLRDTLIHELCHAAVWLLNEISGGHGPFWKAWAAKAQKRFPELPKISVCHEYSIGTKFTYRCTNCGYSFGRHSKSIKLETQRCGHCYGIFELLVNKPGGSAAATPATPRAATGFALFVKENYGSLKKEHSDKKHGDIMKLLGQKFAEVKIGQGSR